MFGVGEGVGDSFRFRVESQVDKVTVHVRFESIGTDEMSKVETANDSFPFSIMKGEREGGRAKLTLRVLDGRQTCNRHRVEYLDLLPSLPSCCPRIDTTSARDLIEERSNPSWEKFRWRGRLIRFQGRHVDR